MPKFYAVRAGKVPGVYSSWPECQAQVTGFSKAVFKSFSTEKEAREYAFPPSEEKKDLPEYYTDGSFQNGKCGFACVDVKNQQVYYSCSLPKNSEWNDLSELLGIELALDISEGQIKIMTDSTYCLDVLKNQYKPKANKDLVLKLLDQVQKRNVLIEHVYSHTGNKYNEIADVYADKATSLQPEKVQFDKLQ
jgi:ribonuclease HI